MTKLFTAIINRFRGVVDDAANAIDDPVVNSKIVIEDSKEYVARIRSQIVDILAKSREFERNAGDAKDQIEKYKTIANNAAKSGNTEVAKSALKKVVESEAQEKVFSKQSEEMKRHVAALRSKLEQAEGKIQTAESKQSVLVAQKANLDAAKAIASINNKFAGEDTPLAKLNDFEAAIERENDKVEAALELGTAEDELAKFEQSSVDVEVEARLAELLKGNK